MFFVGGMALQGNPWKCVCQNTWLARWLLRWMREALQLHTSVVERGQNVQSIVRTITCQTPVDPRMVITSEDEGRAEAAGTSIASSQPATSTAAFQQQSLVDINPDNTCRRGMGRSSSSRLVPPFIRAMVVATACTFLWLRTNLVLL